MVWKDMSGRASSPSSASRKGDLRLTRVLCCQGKAGEKSPTARDETKGAGKESPCSEEVRSSRTMRGNKANRWVSSESALETGGGLWIPSSLVTVGPGSRVLRYIKALAAKGGA